MMEDIDYEADSAAIHTSSSSAVPAAKAGSSDTKMKGRGHRRPQEDEEEQHRPGRGRIFEKIDQEPGSGPAQCKKLIVHVVQFKMFMFLYPFCCYWYSPHSFDFKLYLASRSQSIHPCIYLFYSIYSTLLSKS